MKGWPARIVIVGGGTAGWLSALVIGDAARRGGRPCAITVIESSKLGTIGVGEGTTAVFRQMLQHLGIDEMQFLGETDATIKYGIRHRDWRRLGQATTARSTTRTSCPAVTAARPSSTPTRSRMAAPWAKPTCSST